MIRLFIGADLRPGLETALAADKAHYLVNVMRVTLGAELLLFNGRDGEWLARAVEVAKGRCVLRVEAPRRPQTQGADLDLLIALVKRAPLETIVEKAAELGARRVRLIRSERTNADHANLARLTAIATEAAEQTGRLDVPVIIPPEKLDRVLTAWDARRGLMFCDEAGEAAPAADALAGSPQGAWAVLIGPEGGFSAGERGRIRATPGAVPVSLGPRILRADTAAIAALAIWQSALGDWRGA